jgi:hypothetical protein
VEEIYKDVFVGDNEDYEKIKNKENWRAARMCKYGPGGHQQTLGYDTLAAPKGKNYLSVEKKNHLAVNILDLDDPNMIPFECITTALEYVKRMLDKGYKVLIACNSGRSRGPSTGLMFLRAMGDLPYHFQKAEHIYKTIYPKYSPGMGIRQVAKSHWTELENYLNATITR